MPITTTDTPSTTIWKPGIVPVAVVMISLNEGHNMEAVCRNLSGWAQEVFLVDSYSQDETVDIALRYGIHVVQRSFRGFGDQWNFALSELPITAPWTIKLDPDERITEELKREISAELGRARHDAYILRIRLFFMDRPLPVRLNILRLWRTGRAKFSDVLVNEHAKVEGSIGELAAEIEHHDSPDLDHWLQKQNRYTTAEAINLASHSSLSDIPKFMGTSLQRRMWMKKNFYRLPGRHLLLFLYYWLIKGTWRAGWVGYSWACLRADVMRLIEYKRREIEITGRLPGHRPQGPGKPDPRVQQYD
jgi:glycosyltransferase involved in cell wall biosynthesis